MDIWVEFTFLLLWIELLWIFKYKFVSEQLFLSFLGVYTWEQNCWALRGDYMILLSHQTNVFLIS